MKFNINKYLIDDIENKDHPSDFEIQNNMAVLILRLPFIDVKKEKIEIVSYAFLIKEKVYIYNREKKEFEILGDFDDLHKFLDIRLDKILAKLNRLHIKIAKMEDDLYENKKEDFSKIWLECKKDLVLIERLIGHAMVAYERFLRHFKEKLENNYGFLDLKEHFERAFRFSHQAIEKVDYLYDFYKTRQDEKMNNIMFVLTLISGIFLPLTLITGFFGMNTGGLPLANDPNGTLKAVIIGVVLEIPVVYIIWKMMKS
ncbi:magnesium transporter [Lebetimonas natsushimae]|uniref:Magnesium transporter n=1 Tax=Lebetimonas natsushimae TaxID=1936991 RepID=A0A292YFR4_9BACT|nr:CorA family divalent cation transporter [Lebetimonas natsushimae]GAX88026.1 magnesium transporter [Lebetimonas natsushimae]